MSMSESSSVPFSVMKLLPHKSSEWSSLVSGPEAKSSEITNPTSFTVNYHLGGLSGIFRTRKEYSELQPVCFLSIHLFCHTNPMVCLCGCRMRETYRNEYEVSLEPCSAVSQCLIMTEGSPQKESFVGVYTDLPTPEDTQDPCERSNQKWAKRVG